MLPVEVVDAATAPVAPTPAPARARGSSGAAPAASQAQEVAPAQPLGASTLDEPAEGEGDDARVDELEADEAGSADIDELAERESEATVPSGRRPRERSGPRSNALGVLIERRFADPSSPVRSYSELERRSHISREALSRYVTPRADRRRSPTIDTLDAIAEAMHLSLEQVSRAAVAGSHGLALPEEAERQARDEIVNPLISSLSDEQFYALIELLRQMQPRTPPS
ncbi:MAG TPA: helix-turn-helix transcriptional regulator [Ktedonobacterales bacterium]|nr:helix-turn-helix transcriptional regulator [Ktedonobacterales bacterium]